MIAVVGSLSRDRVAGAPPRVGGGSFHAARALRLAGGGAVILAKCAAADRPELLPGLLALGLPVRFKPGERTTSFSFSYDRDVRTMTVDAVGDAWTPAEAAGLGRIGWVHVAPLLRSDFPAETLASLARGRRLLLDGQGLVRVPYEGPLELDADFDRDVLRHVSILKLAEEEADVLGDLESLGVAEIVVTMGSRGSVVHAEGRSEHVPVAPLPADPTGAGDGFAAAYLASRAAGQAPVAAARRASAIVAAMLA